MAAMACAQSVELPAGHLAPCGSAPMSVQEPSHEGGPSNGKEDAAGSSHVPARIWIWSGTPEHLPTDFSHPQIGQTRGGATSSA